MIYERQYKLVKDPKINIVFNKTRIIDEINKSMININNDDDPSFSKGWSAIPTCYDDNFK